MSRTAEDFRDGTGNGRRFRVPQRWRMADEELVDAVAAVLWRDDWRDQPEASWADAAEFRKDGYRRNARAVLAAFPLASQDREMERLRDEVERLTGQASAWLNKLTDTESARDTLTAERDELRAQLAQVPEVPDGHELVVLPTWWADERAGYGGLIADAARAAIARRPKPEPDTERVPWWEAVGRRVLDQDGERVTIEHVQCGDGAGPSVTAYNASKRRDNSLLRVPCLVATDGTVEVLVEVDR